MLVNMMGPRRAPGASLHCSHRDGTQETNKDQPGASLLGSMSKDMGGAVLWGQRDGGSQSVD